MFQEYKPLIEDANRHIYAVAKKTTLDHAHQLSARLENQIWLKREDQQPVFSYKLRGAFNLIRTLSKAEKSAGIIAASAGNHAQGVALAAQREKIPALIVMPKTTPEIKISSVKRMQTELVLHGNTYDDAYQHALSLARDQGRCFIPPYDHPLVIAGQATVGVEIMAQCAQMPDMIFVPVGGGGLIAGIALYVKSINPAIRIIGVEPDEAPCMHHALVANERVLLEHIGIFADGAAVRQVGKEPFRIAKELVDEVLLVNISEICAAVQDIFEDTRSIPEPAGALALAGLKQYVKKEGVKGKSMVAIFSGANVNFDRLRHIAELSALGAHHEAIIAVSLPERPGSFRRFCHDIGARLITEFNYRYADSKTASVFAGVQLKNGTKEAKKLLDALRQKGYQAFDLSEDEIAKMHVRYMVGGHAPQIKNELLYRFEFPERPGALLHFLNQIGDQWNISLFHYRNHGAAYGRVLMGIQVHPEEHEKFQQCIRKIGIKFWEEGNNQAYRMFLG